MQSVLPGVLSREVGREMIYSLLFILFNLGLAAALAIQGGTTSYIIAGVISLECLVYSGYLLRDVRAQRAAR